MHAYVLYVCMYVGVGMGGLSVLIDIRMYLHALVLIKCWIHVRTYLHMSEPLMGGSANTHVFIC